MDDYLFASIAKPSIRKTKAKSIAVLICLVPLVFIGCESEEKLNPITELSGSYCNEPKIGGFEICLCYEFTPEGKYEMLYGSKGAEADPDSKPLTGTYTLSESTITSVLIAHDGTRVDEEWTLMSSRKIQSNSDKSIYRKKNKTPELCLKQ